jgi:hypothetical protein
MRNVFPTLGLLAVSSMAAHGAVVAGYVERTGRLSQPAASAVAEGSWTADTRSGWTDGNGERRWQFNLRDDRGDSHWGFGIRPSEIEGLPAAAIEGTAANVQFAWMREAGAFRFTGTFDRGRGSGRYAFTPSDAYGTAMQGLGYRLAAADLQRFAVLDVTTSYVRDLAAAGYRNVDVDELARMQIHRVSVEQIRDLRALGYNDLPTETLIQLRIHQVTTDFARGLADRGYTGLLPEDLIRMRIHRVTIQEIDDLKALGFSGLGADELVRFRIHKVTPAYIREMREVGFATVTEDQLVRMRIHKVDAQFVKDARADGYAMTTPGDAVDLAIRGPRYTKARRK